MKLIDSLKSDWKTHLDSEFSKSYFQQIEKRILAELESGNTFFPDTNTIFNAFNSTSWAEVKVVILGQDPYHNIGQANGLSFSVPQSQAIPPSLRNIFIELNSDLNIPPPPHGDLSSWAQQGVLLLNAILTVRAHQAASHRDFGWEIFTNNIIQKLSVEKTNLVFVLWGNFARSKKHLINPNKHLILESAHPSPLSANKGGFFNTKPFSKTNAYLSSKGIKPINWNIAT